MPGGSSTDSGEPNAHGLSRRSAIKKIALVIAGVSIASISGATILDSIERNLNERQVPPANQSNVSTTASQISSSSAAFSFITIKAVYFGMATQLQGTKQDYITLKCPAFLKDVISEVTALHPSLLPMVGAMQILIDGSPAEPNQQLSNRDEIDFIPVQAGG